MPGKSESAPVTNVRKGQGREKTWSPTTRFLVSPPRTVKTMGLGRLQFAAGGTELPPGLFTYKPCGFISLPSSPFLLPPLILTFLNENRIRVSWLETVLMLKL